MRAIGRVFSALDCFTAGQPKLSLQEICDRIGLAKSTTFRLVHTLEELGYLIRLADQRYTLSLKVCRLAWIAESGLDMPGLARPVLETLAQATGERASLHEVRGGNQRCVDVVAGPGAATPAVHAERRMPFGMGAESLVLLAHMSEAARAPVLPEVARATGCPLHELRSILGNIRRDGWAVSHGGAVPGASGIAAPILGPDAAARFCVAVTVPTARVRGRVGRLSRLVREAAAEISVRLGATDAATIARAEFHPRQRSETIQP